MMHPDREKFKPYLLDKLGNVPVVLDNKNSIWDTCQRAWAEFDPTADYHVVIQDDALVCDDFKEKAEKLQSDLNGVENETDEHEKYKKLQKIFGDDFEVPEEEKTAKKQYNYIPSSSSSGME